MLFSVIVPIYNIEKYIKRCIDSVLMQEFADYELILVDDGSPDRCGEICDEYAKIDQRIKVIHKENGGLVSARQAGIKEACGEYIINLDGDDAISGDMLKNAAEIIARTNADIVAFSYKTAIGDSFGDIFHEPCEEGFYDRKRIEKEIFPKLLCDENMMHMHYFLWGKAIRRDIALDHQLKVSTKISLGEDICCMLPCYLDAESVFIKKAVGYFYTMRNDSLSTEFKTNQITHIAEVVGHLKKINGRKPADFDAQISRYSCFMCFAILAAAAEGNHKKALGKIKELIKNSRHYDEKKNAKFNCITKKSRIAIFLMKIQAYKAAFHFLHLCKVLKDIRKGDR